LAPGLALLMLSCLLPAGQARASTRAKTAVPPPLGGINLPGLGYGSTPAQADREVAEAGALHARIVRVELPWAVLQPHGPGELEPQALAYTDRLMDDAAAQGIAVIALIDATPCWASAAPAPLLQACVAGADSQANGWPPARPSDFGALAGALAGRYGGKMTALEVWNEPDQVNEKYFAGPEKPQRYAAVLKAGYTAVKQADPRVKVLAGSLVGSNGVFLKLLYAAGIKGYYDGIAVHFYTLTLASLRMFRAVQVASGDTTPLWLDEFGWSSCAPQKIQEEQSCVTPAVQAQNITNIFRSLSHTSYIAADTLYKLRDSGTQFGVLNEQGAHKPAYGALANALASPFGSPSRVTLKLRRAGRQILAIGSGPVGDYMRMEVFQRNTLRYRAIFTLDSSNRYSLKLPAALGSHGLRVRVFQEWAGVHGAAQKRI
jgi:polysaccharide biosynthesis protein PslG